MNNYSISDTLHTEMSALSTFDGTFGAYHGVAEMWDICMKCYYIIN